MIWINELKFGEANFIISNKKENCRNRRIRERNIKAFEQKFYEINSIIIMKADKCGNEGS